MNVNKEYELEDEPMAQRSPSKSLLRGGVIEEQIDSSLPWISGGSGGTSGANRSPSPDVRKRLHMNTASKQMSKQQIRSKNQSPLRSNSKNHQNSTSFSAETT